MSVQAQLSLSEQQIQEMISQRIRKMDEIRTSVAEIKVKQSHQLTLETTTAVGQNL